jgi:hypothetical protein
MAVTRAMVAALSVAAGLPAYHGPAQAGGGYCVLPDRPIQSGPYLVATASFLDWIHPNPPPAEPEPEGAERLDFAGFPNVSALDVTGPRGRPETKVIATFTTNVDKVVTLTNAAAVSEDGGRTFGPAGQTPLRESPIELHDGRFFATEYYPARTGPHTALLGVLTSSALEDGESWLRSEAVLTTPGDLLPGGAAHGAPIQLADGTILITAYARYSGTGAYQSEVYASRDGGRYSTLHQSRSTDGGHTWEPVRELRLAGYDCVVRGVAPRLLLMPGGALVLSAGRPDNWLTVSPDGLGREWLEPRVTYHNRDGIVDVRGSSGYTGLAAVGPHRFIQVFDNCKLAGVRPDGLLDETACPAHGRFEYGGRYAVKRLLFDVATPGVRLDLAALRRRGALRVSTDMRWTSPRRPRTRPGGALDGSTGYWSSAVARGSGHYVLHLDRPYPLARIGLSLRPGHPASARVYVSGNGRSWGEPVVTIKDRIDHALRYDEIGRTARHVKIVTEPSAGCDPEIGRKCAVLNEVELYS